MDEPRVGTVLKVLCGSQAKGLAGVVSVSRVCSEQQGSYSNKDFVFHSKLQKRVKNRKRYKKERKGRKGDGVCGKNKEGTRRGRSSFEKDVRRNEKIHG